MYNLTFDLLNGVCIGVMKIWVYISLRNLCSEYYLPRELHSWYKRAFPPTHSSLNHFSTTSSHLVSLHDPHCRKLFLNNKKLRTHLINLGLVSCHFSLQTSECIKYSHIPQLFDGIKVTGYSLLVTFNCACARTILYGL